VNVISTYTIPLLSLGAVLAVLSIVKCEFEKTNRFTLVIIRPRPLVAILSIALLVCGGVGAFFVVNGQPSDKETILEPKRPVEPARPLLEPILRLKSAWDSEESSDWAAAETLAWISESAYLPPVDADREFRKLGFKRVIPIVASSMIGYVMWEDEVAVIAFRGTDPGEVSDWLANLHDTSVQTAHGRVHAGFYGAYESLRPQILTICEECSIPTSRLWITGHSLGGALAVVCALDLSDDERIGISGVMTFGQPKIAKGDAAEYLESRFAHRYAYFVNHADVVPRVPPGYKHCGSLVWFTDNGIRRTSKINVVFQAPDVTQPMDEVPPPVDLLGMSETEFRELKAKLKTEKEAILEIPEGPQPVMATVPFVDDHSMELYLQRVRSLLGVSSPSEPH